MTDTFRSLWIGWSSATALWPVVLLLYLVDTAMALILAIPPAAQLGRVFGHSAMAPALAGPITLNLLIEANQGLQGFPLPWPLYLLVPALSVLVGTFLRGGILSAVAEHSKPFRWDSFFAGCTRFFGRFLLLLLFLVPGLVVVALLFVVVGLLMGLVSFGDWGDLFSRLALLGFLIYMVMLALDYARISLVLEPDRSLVRHAISGTWFLVRRFPWVLLLGLVYGLMAALIAAGYPALLQLSPLFATFLPALLAQQLLMLLASWQRLAMLGSEMALFRK